MKIKGYHRAIKFSSLNFDKSFNQSMELLNQAETGNSSYYQWNFDVIRSTKSVGNYYNHLNIENEENPKIYISRLADEGDIQRDEYCSFSNDGIDYRSSLIDESTNITIKRYKTINLEHNLQKTELLPTSISGNAVSVYENLIRASGSSFYYTKSTPDSHISTKYTPQVTYDSNTDATTVSLQEEDVTLSRLANTDGNYILPENAEIHFGEQYKASKERILIPLYHKNGSVTVGGDTFQEYYQDPDGINYVITTDRNLVAIGTITEGAIGVTEVLPTWKSSSLFKRDDDTVPDHYDQLYGLMMFFAESSSSYEIIVPQSCQLLSLENYRGKIDVSNCALNWESSVDIVDSTNGTLIISSEQEESLGERIVNGRLFDENGIQVEVKS